MTRTRLNRKRFVREESQKTATRLEATLQECAHVWTTGLGQLGDSLQRRIEEQAFLVDGRLEHIENLTANEVLLRLD